GFHFYVLFGVAASLAPLNTSPRVLSTVSGHLHAIEWEREVGSSARRLGGRVGGDARFFPASKQ
ncbi:hypothetical protein Taro_048215, partial [Colocasia esculenta]|nr:hypothetical protein [Colocasia esculenta]